MERTRCRFKRLAVVLLYGRRTSVRVFLVANQAPPPPPFFKRLDDDDAPLSTFEYGMFAIWYQYQPSDIALRDDWDVYYERGRKPSLKNLKQKMKREKLRGASEGDWDVYYERGRKPKESKTKDGAARIEGDDLGDSAARALMRHGGRGRGGRGQGRRGGGRVICVYILFIGIKYAV